MPAYRALDPSLTAPIAEPASPAKACVMSGLPVPCVLDGLLQIDAWRALLQRCNADRATSAQVTKPPGDT